MRGRRRYTVPLSRFRSMRGDDRRDVFTVADPGVWSNAEGVAVAVAAGSLVPQNGGYQLRTVPFGSGRQICATERFVDQPCVVGAGTAFLVAPDMVATNAHVAYRLTS
jgi:hypothetical protein